jgi:hypothetical protein
MASCLKGQLADFIYACHFRFALTVFVAAKLKCLTGYKVEVSKFNSSRRAVEMW